MRTPLRTRVRRCDDQPTLGRVEPSEPTIDDAGADRRHLRAAALVQRFQALPPIDADRLRKDIDAVVDQRLPGTVHTTAD
jgi:hypothetical protein